MCTPLAGRIDDGCVPSSSGAHVVGPHAGGVHDEPGADGERLAVGFDAAAWTRPSALFSNSTSRGVVRDRGAVVGRGARDREGEAGVVGLRVVVHVRRGHVVGVQRRHVAQRPSFDDALVELPDAEPTREVVGPHRRAEQPGQPPGEQAVAGEHREQEREDAHQVGRGVAQHLALGEGLVHETDLALLQVADARRAPASTISTRCPRRGRRARSGRCAAHGWRRRAPRRRR